MGPFRDHARIARPTRHAVPGYHGGFTLLETALATIIIGVGVLAVIEAQQAFLTKNAWSSNASTATLLANELRERTRLFARHDQFSGGLYFTDLADEATLTGWGPEGDEVTPADFDDLDDFDGAVFGDAPNLPEGFELRARYPGPLDALAQVVSETTWNGVVEMMPLEDDEFVPVSLRGWTQCVQVTKVNPADITDAVAGSARVTNGNLILRDLEEFPVRVTVIVMYQPSGEEIAGEVSRVSWVASP